MGIKFNLVKKENPYLTYLTYLIVFILTFSINNNINYYIENSKASYFKNMYLVISYIIFLNYNNFNNFFEYNNFTLNIIFITIIILINNNISNVINENFSNLTNDKILPNLGICSKKCCPNYYQSKSLPIVVDDRIKDSDIGTKYVTSNMSCSDGVKDKGCVCINKNMENNNYDFLNTNKYHNLKKK